MQDNVQVMNARASDVRKKESFWKRLLVYKGAVTGMILVAVIIAVAAAAPMIAPNDPLKVDMSARFEGPGAVYWFGTDNLGRCVASRVIWGARMSLSHSITVLLFMLAISIPVGLTAGYAGGRVDGFIMRIIDICLSMPTFLLALAIVGALGPSPVHMIIAMASVWWAPYARLIRGFAMQMKEQDFILAAKAAGCSHIQIVFRHILRNIAPSIIVMSALEIGSIILAIVTYSFIGLGAQPPVPEWGIMLNDSKEFIQTQPQLMLYPGMAIIITVMSFNLLGEGLKNVLRDRM